MNSEASPASASEPVAVADSLLPPQRPSVPDVLLLPGWRDSGAGHWQTCWAERYGYRRVEQHDWEHPLRGDWMARLEEVVVDNERPLLLVAHSLGCLLVAAWASHSRHGARVRGALLVAPPDVEQMPLADALPGWAPIPLQRLPFPSIVVGSANDPYTTPERTRAFAGAWASARCVDAGPLGHLNADSALGDWDFGHRLLDTLRADAAYGTAARTQAAP